MVFRGGTIESTYLDKGVPSVIAFMEIGIVEPPDIFVKKKKKNDFI